MERVHINELHSNHNAWMNKLCFIIDEIGLFKQKLEDISHKNEPESVAKIIKEYQDHFLYQTQMIDIHLNEIKNHENSLNIDENKIIVGADNRLYQEHKDLQLKMEAFNKIYINLKNKYLKFVSESNSNNVPN
jgi:hypothetical protein